MNMSLKDVIVAQVPQETGDMSPPHEQNSSHVTPNVTPPIISYGTMEARLLRLLEFGTSNKFLHENMGVSLSTVKTYLRRLIAKSYITKSRKVLINLDALKVPQETAKPFSSVVGYEDSTGNKGVTSFKKTSTSFGTLRAHNIRFKFDLLNPPLPDVIGCWRLLKLRNTDQYHYEYNGLHLVLTTKSLLVTLPPLDVKQTQSVNDLCVSISEKLKSELELKFTGLLLGSCDTVKQLTSPHYALQNHPFAKWLTSNGMSINSGCVHVDASKPDCVPEIEITSSPLKDFDSHDLGQRFVDQVTDQMNPQTPLISDVMKSVDALNAQVATLQASLAECTQVLKATCDVQKVNTDHLGILLKSLAPKVDQNLSVPYVRPYYTN